MMTKFNIGDKVRVINVEAISFGEDYYYNGLETEVVNKDDDGDVYLRSKSGREGVQVQPDEFHAIERITDKPKKSERITALESQVAALEAKVDALESAGKYPLTERFNQESAEVDAILADIERKAKPTPNEQRADVIKRAKAFVADLEKRMASDRINREGNHTFKYCTTNAEFHISENKRVVTALVKDVSEGRLRTKGIAKCDPDDVFNADIGKAIALARALGVEVPVEFVKAVQPTEVVVGMKIVSDGYVFKGVPQEVTRLRPELEKGAFNTNRIGYLTEDNVKIIEDTDAVYE